MESNETRNDFSTILISLKSNNDWEDKTVPCCYSPSVLQKEMIAPDNPVDWQEEANAVIRDVRHHVHRISVSNIPSSNKKIYFNLTTLELKDFCVELTQAGFQIVGEKYDSEETKGKYSVFETPYSMLDSLSPAYRNSFGEELLRKLKKLEREQGGGAAEDAEDEG